MKRKFIGLLCACLLLSGCQIGSTPDVPTEPPATEAPTTAPTVSALPLLDQGMVLEASNNLLYIPNETVEGMVQPNMRLLGHGLLLSEYRDQAMVLNHISLEDGALVASASISAGAETKLSIGSGEIALCDRESGLVTILNEKFQILRTYEVPTEGDEWYLNSELDTLYIFYYDRGLLARNLETGKEIWLVDNGFQVESMGGGSSYLFLRYTDRADQKTYIRCLNLSMAALETLPVDGQVSNIVRQGEIWLLRKGDEQILVRGDELRSLACTDSEVQLLPLRRHLLVMDPSRRNLALYDTNGGFLSRCSLPQSSHAMIRSDFVWSGYWEGYFFMDFDGDAIRLMFWDVRPDTDGDDLPMSPLGEAQQSQPVVEQQLYERAEKLSQRFGVDIRIAERCAMDYTHYDTYALTDPTFIRSALDILENALSQYPDGFFRQLLYGSVESIRIELVGGLMLKDTVEDRKDSAGAFAHNRGSYYLIALDGFLLRSETIYHEFSHVIDKRLEWDSLIREDALYSEEAWLALQPEGFQYAMSYLDTPEATLAYLNTDYFVSDYALTFPTEDRAVLMAAAMEQQSWDFEAGSGRRMKMQFYADCIRDCFDTTGWPKTTLWEQVLK